jgi:hypothetical protein
MLVSMHQYRSSVCVNEKGAPSPSGSFDRRGVGCDFAVRVLNKGLLNDTKRDTSKEILVSQKLLTGFILI